MLILPSFSSSDRERPERTLAQVPESKMVRSTSTSSPFSRSLKPKDFENLKKRVRLSLDVLALVSASGAREGSLSTPSNWSLVTANDSMFR